MCLDLNNDSKYEVAEQDMVVYKTGLARGNKFHPKWRRSFVYYRYEQTPRVHIEQENEENEDKLSIYQGYHAYEDPFLDDVDIKSGDTSDSIKLRAKGLKEAYFDAGIFLFVIPKGTVLIRGGKPKQSDYDMKPLAAESMVYIGRDNWLGRFRLWRYLNKKEKLSK